MSDTTTTPVPVAAIIAGAEAFHSYQDENAAKKISDGEVEAILTAAMPYMKGASNSDEAGEQLQKIRDVLAGLSGPIGRDFYNEGQGRAIADPGIIAERILEAMNE